jgi:hypothetical protein
MGVSGRLDALQFRFGTGLELGPSKGFRLRHDSGRAQRAALAVRLSKILDYLVDNIYVHILSYLMGSVQEQSGCAAQPVPNRESCAPFFGRNTTGGVPFGGRRKPRKRKSLDGAPLGVNERDGLGHQHSSLRHERKNTNARAGEHQQSGIYFVLHQDQQHTDRNGCGFGSGNGASGHAETAGQQQPD